MTLRSRMYPAKFLQVILVFHLVKFMNLQEIQVIHEVYEVIRVF
jgi:chorismate mutase